MGAALNYHEPDIISILILSSFLLLLNTSNYVLNKYLSCGLVAQIIIGIAWGTPGGKLLDNNVEYFITWLGYIGLVLLVFEGGLSTNVHALQKNLVLSFAVAFTGITIPIALSFILTQLADATPLQSFASGAALCSTSLGTTFTILKASDFAQTRLGSVLTSAAMLDDVIGLVMIQVISNLNGTLRPASIVRPVGVSIAFSLVTVFFCFSMKYCAKAISKAPMTLFLIGMVTAASYAGTSNLFASYLAGVCCSWWYESDAVQKSKRYQKDKEPAGSTVLKSDPQPMELSLDSCSKESSEAVQIYKRYYLPVVDGILKPFFFASIGFAIPITQMFEGMIIWRGLIYALLMIVAKMFTGLWLVHFDLNLLSRLKLFVSYMHKQTQQLASRGKRKGQPSIELSCSMISPSRTVDQITGQSSLENTTTNKQTLTKMKKSNDHKSEQATSLYPATILGIAMVARGEIGFLIAATAQSSGVLGQDSSQTIYLIVIWAVVLCTVVGPILTGLLVKRVKRLQRLERISTANERKDPLGPWGLL